MLIDKISPPYTNTQKIIRLANARKNRRQMDELELRDEIDILLGKIDARLENLRYACYDMPMDSLMQMITEFTVTTQETMDEINETSRGTNSAT